MTKPIALNIQKQKNNYTPHKSHPTTHRKPKTLVVTFHRPRRVTPHRTQARSPRKPQGGHLICVRKYVPYFSPRSVRHRNIHARSFSQPHCRHLICVRKYVPY